MITLAIDTSTRTLAVAVLKEGALLAWHNYAEQMRHAKHVVSVVERVLSEAGISAGEITRCACGVGPGSYTGLRIGHAFVKGFAVARTIPVMPFSSMTLIGHNMCAEHNRIAVVLDARRAKYYCSIIERAGEDISVSVPDCLCDEHALESLLKEYDVCAVTGDALARHADTVRLHVPEQCHFYEESLWQADASKMACLLAALPERTVAAETLLPNYMRISEAEEKAAEKENGA